LTVVRVHEDESFETALRKFRHKCKKAGIFAEVRKRRYHEKPSARKRRKILSAKRQTMKGTVD
jgi:small subunit ribosomal protein S21